MCILGARPYDVIFRSTLIVFPSYSTNYGSSACLDFVCQSAMNNLPNGLPDEYVPVLFAAHHVDTLHLFELEISYVRPGPPELIPDKTPGLIQLANPILSGYRYYICHTPLYCEWPAMDRHADQKVCFIALLVHRCDLAKQSA